MMRIKHEFLYRRKKRKWIWQILPKWRGGRTHAEIDFSGCTIYANPVLAKDEKVKLDTFLHEMLHMIKKEDKGKRAARRLTHPMIYWIAGALTEFLVENNVELVWRRKQ